MPRRCRRERDERSERGETLAEVLVTISIMGILFAAVLGAIGVSAKTSDISRKEGTAETLLRSYAEQVQTLTYTNCATTSTYALAGFTVPGGYTVGITSVKYWSGANPATFVSTCPSPDQGAQSIDLRAQSTDGRVSETVTVYKRAS